MSATTAYGGALGGGIGATATELEVYYEVIEEGPFETDTIGTFKVDERSGVPIWLQIRKRLVYLITSGKYECGERLPSVREMSVKLGVNYNTVNKVYQDLERDGFIVTKRGKGSYVADTSSIDYANDDGEIEALAFDFVQAALGKGLEPNDVIELVLEQMDKLKHARRV